MKAYHWLLIFYFAGYIYGRLIGELSGGWLLALAGAGGFVAYLCSVSVGDKLDA